MIWLEDVRISTLGLLRKRRLNLKPRYLHHSFNCIFSVLEVPTREAHCFGLSAGQNPIGTAAGPTSEFSFSIVFQFSCLPRLSLF